jgi:hypothetical protein
MIKFKFTEEHETWFSFYPKRNKGTGFHLVLDSNGYFDPRPQINTNITTLVGLTLPFISLWLLPLTIVLFFYGWGSLYIHLPWDTKNGNTAENKSWGLMFYHADSGFPSEMWFRGWKSFNFPWAFNYYKRELLLKSGWKKEEKGDKSKWENDIVLDKYPYVYTLKSGEKQYTTATVHQEKRYWRRWFNLHTKCSHYIEIQFSDEVGERSGSWKGGCLGCSYEIKKGESPLECLQRMSKERKF